MDSNNKINSLALAGFITSIISLFLNFWGIVGIVGVVLLAIFVPMFSMYNDIL